MAADWESPDLHFDDDGWTVEFAFSDGTTSWRASTFVSSFDTQDVTDFCESVKRALETASLTCEVRKLGTASETLDLS